MRRFLLLLTLAVCPAFSALAQCAFELDPGLEYPTGADTRNFVVANLNGDAWPDAALRVEQTDKIRIMLGTQGGGFAAATEFSIGRTIVFDLEAGDFNNDGKTDLITTTGWVFQSPQTLMPQVLVLLGKGNGTFHAPLTTDVFQNPEHISLGDFNHDGKLDAMVAKASSFVPMLGVGDGTLAQKAEIVLLPESSTVYETDGITHGDFDEDGHLDVALAESISDQLHVFWGGGGNDGKFVRGPRLPLAGGYDARALTAGDYDGDGDTDLAYGQENDGVASDYELILFRSNGSARTFQTGVGYGSVPYGAWDAQSADLDGDGDLDVLLATISESIVMFNDGTGAFSSQETYPGGGFESTTADMNGDGSLDLISAGYGFNQYVWVFLNDCSRAGLTLTSAPNPSVVNTNATFTGTIVPPATATPTGTLTLKRGATVLASGDISVSPSVSATLNSLPLGTHTITALYSGDANFKSETKQIQHVVELPPFGAPSNLTALSTGGPST